MRNHGDSDHHDDIDYNYMAEDIIRYADSHNIDRFTLLGHSMGGKTAMTAAMLWPNRISGLIVVDTPPKNAKYDSGFISHSVGAVIQQKK
jgi:esterase